MNTLRVLLLCLLAGAFPVWSEVTTVEDLIEVFQGRDVATSWTADMTMTMNMMGMSMVYEGEMKQKDSRSLMTMNMNMMGQNMSTRTIMDADGISWTVTEVGGMTQVMKMDMSEMMAASSEMLGVSAPTPGPGGFGNFADVESTLMGYEGMYDLTVSGPTDIDGVPVYLIEGVTTEPVHDAIAANPVFEQFEMSMDGVILHVGAEDGFVRRIEVVGTDGPPFMVQELRNVVLNAEIDDAEFEYTPPEGVRVIDMTEMMRENMEALESGEFSFEDFDGMDREYNTKFSPGDVAPDFEATLLDGTAFRLSDYRGKIVLLDFWATWCPPCIAELPHVTATYERHGGEGFEIIGVSLDDSRDDLAAFLAEHPKANWPQVFDGLGWDSPFAALYGVDAIPYTLLLDGEGVVRGVSLRGTELEEAVSALLSERGD